MLLAVRVVMASGVIAFTAEFSVFGADMSGIQPLTTESHTDQRFYPEENMQKINAESGCYWSFNAETPLNLDLWFGFDTIDNQGMHPDIVEYDQGFGPLYGDTVIGINRAGFADTIVAIGSTPAWHYWMAFTPYPYTLASYENPTIRASNLMDAGWERPYAIGFHPAGDTGLIDTVWIKDPVSSFYPAKTTSYYVNPDTIWNEYYKMTLATSYSWGHNADPEFIYDTESKILLTAFLSASSDYRNDRIIAISSTNGLTWNESDTLVLAYNDPLQSDPYDAWSFLSPSISKFGSNYYFLWFVDKTGLEKGTQIIRMILPGLGLPPVQVDTCYILPPQPNKQIWHMKIRFSEKDATFYLLATINPKNTTTMDASGQYLYTSSDGLNWNLDGMVIANGPQDHWDYFTYRSTFLLKFINNNLVIPVWYSGAYYKQLKDLTPENDENPAILVWGTGFTIVSTLAYPGDINTDCHIDILDGTFLLSYLYKQGNAPSSLRRGDLNSDCFVNILDLTYLIRYLYLNGSPPFNGCELLE